MKRLAFLLVVLPVYASHHHKSHSRDHDRREPIPWEHPVAIRVEIPNLVPQSPVSRPRTPRPITPLSSPVPSGPYTEVDSPQTPTATRLSEGTRVKLALISLGSTFVGAGLTAIIMWRSTCGGK